ncbi:hypothetical protein Tco_1525489 [Tanacetum coccineum]
MENIMYFNNGVGPSSSVGIPLTQEEAEKRALAHNISMRYEILEEVRPVINTLAYHDKYRKLLDEIWADKVRLDGMVIPEEERVMVKVKGQMLKEKRDPRAFIFPIRLESRIDENALADTGSDANTMPYGIYEQLVGFTTLSAKFLILEIPVDRDAPIVVGRGFLDMIGGNIDIPNRIFTTFDGLTRQTFRAARSEKIKIAESDSDDEEDYVIKRNEMGTPIHNSRPIRYQNDTNPVENMTLSTLESVINPFRKISVWKKAVSFLGSLPAKLRDVEWKPDYKMCYSNPELANRNKKTEIHLTDPYGNIYTQAFVTKPTKRKLSKYHKLSDIMSPNCAPHILSQKVTTSGSYDHEAGSSRAKRSRNIETVEKALLLDVHHEFLEWRGCSRDAKSRYNPRDEIDQMLKISLKEAQSEEEIFFSVAWVRAFNICEPIYPELFRKFYATYEFDEVCASDELQSKKIISFRLGGRAHSLTLLEFARRLGLYHAEELEEDGFNIYFQGVDEKKGARSQRDSQICYGQFISKIARKTRVLTDATIHSLSTSVYCRDLDRTTLKELIDSEDRLIPSILVDDVQRFAAQRPPREFSEL